LKLTLEEKVEDLVENSNDTDCDNNNGMQRKKTSNQQDVSSALLTAPGRSGRTTFINDNDSGKTISLLIIDPQVRKRSTHRA